MICSTFKCKNEATGRVLLPIKLGSVTIRNIDFLTQPLCESCQVRICTLSRDAAWTNPSMGATFAVPLNYEERMESARECGRKLEEGR